MSFEPIGVVRHGYPDDEVRRMRVDGTIVIYDKYVEGLRGLEEFSHIIVISYLHRYRGAPLVVRPKRLEARGLQAPEVGVFATDSPDRPNPIGVSIVRLLEVRRGALSVSDLDLFDGTPVLDIKGFSPTRCPEGARAPRWALADHV
ncbi:MAG: tRNA (N6-threonylcarbamoyladenosine(37)-N6)-methyltransferase TrmO [Thermoproteus sp.]|jgi:tRNA-Thr(GGU) m(6)t(6)A37 methyltransferase TsaA|nr:tRNA (N6-threonylcarbamoyladenosine(37)-N6)-methyltransferase TrmO [Thermoproteus sp.]MDT7881742.1 tRNA (N6-threonylcarbamoyladenosine(37)-N6)-methyltransferase TrmO [Thermoproteus sp.]